MNRILFTLVVSCLFSIAAIAQSDSITAAMPKQFDYCELIGSSSLPGARTTVNIDFGQRTRIFEDTRLKGPDGKAIRFNSMIDALRMRGSDGWELVQVYTTSVANSTTPNAPTLTYHYLLKREAVR